MVINFASYDRDHALFYDVGATHGFGNSMT